MPTEHIGKTRGPNGLGLAGRFARHVGEKGLGCWLWQGSISRLGYGEMRLDRNTKGKAHRVAWELENGPIPEGMEVCHSCDVRACVRVDHLFLGTHLDNMRDASAKGRLDGRIPLKSHCKRGHEFTVANTYIATSGDRRCRTCHRDQVRGAA